jgi:YidC/Oxa1 family membrane protein insertase
VLYWIVSNFWSIAQYKFINRGVMAQGSESSKLKGKDVQDAKIVK